MNVYGKPSALPGSCLEHPLLPYAENTVAAVTEGGQW